MTLRGPLEEFFLYLYEKVIYSDNYYITQQDDSMKERAFLEAVKDLPLFSTRQVSAMLGSRSYSKVYLYRLVERGLITRLRRSLYTVHEDPLIYSTHVYHPSYVSLMYAFQHHGTTTQLPRTIEVMTYESGSVRGVEFIRTGHLWGYQKIRYSGFQIFMADLEKAVIDAVITERTPFDEVLSALDRCDKDRLEEYALRTSISEMKRIGYSAEQAGHFMENLYWRVKMDRNYVSFAPAKGGNRWRVVGD